MMRTGATMPADRGEGWRARGPELALALVAGAACLGFLGSTELWGRREQRAAAEAVDTAEHGRWLVGQVQGRPRLEKPPLPRWVVGALIRATGRRDEATVRLPNALAALALVGLAYAWGRSAGGRSVGLAAGFALASTAPFLVEMRQAGNDGMLALFVALALYAGARRLGVAGGDGVPGARGWAVAGLVATGLGFLCKGPVIFLWVGLPLAGFLASRRQLGAGSRLLADARGLALLAGLVLIWPVAVAFRHPAAVGVWWLELGQKAGGLGVEHGNARGSILLGGLALGLPWAPLALASLAGPVRRWRARRREIAVEPEAPALALAWWWAFAPLAALGTWDVAKPSYYLPAVPALAILAGSGWVRLAARARDAAHGLPARLALQGAWAGLVVAGAVLPVIAHQVAPGWAGWALAGGVALIVAGLAGARAWRAGGDALSLAPMAVGLVAVALIGYGAIAPAGNPARGHRALADSLARALPAGSPAWFLDDLEEGVWFYSPGLDLRPVPGAAPHRGHALRAAATPGRGRAALAEARAREAVARLDAWADRAGPGAFLLVRAKLLDHLGPFLPPHLVPVLREAGVERPAVVLLRVRPPAEVAALPAPAPTRR